MRGGEFHVDLLGLDGHAIADGHEALNDDAFAWGESFADDAEAVEEGAECDRTVNGFLLGIDDPDVRAALVVGDGGVADEEGVVLGTAGDADFCEEAGGHEAVLVGKDAAGEDGAGFWIEGIVNEVDLAEVRPVGLADESHFGGNLLEKGAVALAVFVELTVFERRTLIDLDVAVDGVEGDDGGEDGGVFGAAGDEVAFGDTGVADAAGDGGADLGEIEVEFGGAEGGFGTAHGGFASGNRFQASLRLFEGDGLVFAETFGVFGLDGGEFGEGFGFSEDGFGALDGGLEGAGVDGEEEVACFDFRSLDETDLGEVAGYLSADIDLFTGGEAASEFIPVDDTLSDGGGNGDR